MKKLAWLISAAFAPLAFGADLMQVYRAAQDNDPVFAAARAQRDAGVEKKAQGLAGLLPTVSANANTTWNENQVKTPTFQAKPNYNSNGYTVTLSQPLFRWQNWAGYGQGKWAAVQAEANFVQARQDLVLRTAQAYFDLLYAQENLRAVQANKTAITQQLAQAKKNFEVGTATVTDTHEAQARFDLASAQEVVAESDVEVKRRALQAIIGKEPGALAPARANVEIAPPQPAGMDKWVDAAERDAVPVQVQKAALEVADYEVQRQRAGHMPTLDLVANTGKSNTLGVGLQETETRFKNIGLQVNIPLFQGGYVMSKDREAVANRRAAESSLEAAKRQSALSARQAYLGVVNGVAQVRALEAALASSKLALESNKLGYDVGVRINIDVLNAEQQVYTTRRDLAKARYDTLLAQLRLKAAVGALGDEDVQQVNALLDSTAAQ